MKLVAWVSSVLVSGTASASQIYDDFNIPKWTPFNTRGVNVYEQGGRMKVDFWRTAAGRLIEGGYRSTCTLSGDFDLFTDYYATQFPAGNGVRIGLVTSPEKGTLDGDAYGRAISERVENPDRGVYTSDFYPIVTIFPGITTSDKAGRLRLQRVGSQLNGYYWDKLSLQWVQTGQTDAYPTEPVYFYLASWTHDYLFQDVAVRVEFDNVRILSGTCENP